MGVVAFVIAGLVAYVLFSHKPMLKTPTTEDVMRHGRHVDA